MTFASFLKHSRRPLHTPDPLLNAYLACRTPIPSSSPGLMASLWRASISRLRSTSPRISRR